RVPQDGRIKATVRGREIDLRVSTMPTMNGESVVMRLLDRSSVSLDFSSLGFTPHTQVELNQVLAEPNGIILVTGPTGSGKTTTLYTALSLLNSTQRKTFTVEDPIEYQLDGVNQIQVQPKIDQHADKAEHHRAATIRPDPLAQDEKPQNRREQSR